MRLRQSTLLTSDFLQIMHDRREPLSTLIPTYFSLLNCLFSCCLQLLA